MKIEEAYRQLKELAQDKRASLEINLNYRPDLSEPDERDALEYHLYIHSMPSSSGCIAGYGSTLEVALMFLEAELFKYTQHTEADDMAARFDELDALTAPAFPPPAPIANDDDAEKGVF